MVAFHKDLASDPRTAEILAALGAPLAPDGVKLNAVLDEKAGGLSIQRSGDTVTVRYSEPVYYYRALGLIFEKEESTYSVTEKARFDMNGLMPDCSRNAVHTVDTCKLLIRQMALMGMNMLMLSTEDTYEIPEEPYFGYMRGRYTIEEFKELDAYAGGFGIEMIPCIQTLAHLGAALKWKQEYASVIDTETTLLVDEPKTYALIERMIAACRASFKSKRIHIGMDEAHTLGRGKYYDIHGDSNRFELLLRHLDKVREICEKYGFENPMMWSDMFFRLGNNGKYYDENPFVPAEVAKLVPQNVTQVYWDYYHDSYEAYDRMIKAHLPMGKPVFAGGAWKFFGILPNLRASIRRTELAFTACADNGVKEVFNTVWASSGPGVGGEGALFSLLPAYQFQAELNFYEKVDEAHLARRLRICTGAELSDFEKLENPDDPVTPPGGFIRQTPPNPHKYLLFQDVLMGLFDCHVPENAATRYVKLYQELKETAKKEGPYRYLFETAAALYGVLEMKAELGLQLKSAYDSGDKDFLKQTASETLPVLVKRVKILRDCVKVQWMKENKVFGFEPLDIEYGGLVRRLESAKERLEEYLNGEIPSLPELEEKRLPFQPDRDGKIFHFYAWGRMASASLL